MTRLVLLSAIAGGIVGWLVKVANRRTDNRILLQGIVFGAFVGVVLSLFVRVLGRVGL